MKIYFACALAYSTPEYREEITKLKEKLRSKFEILEFFGYGIEADSKTIYEHDAECVKNSDLVVAECSYPSTGVGIEIGLALSLKKPVIVLAKQNAQASAMVIGNSNPLLQVLRYNNFSELEKLIIAAVETIKA